MLVGKVFGGKKGRDVETRSERVRGSKGLRGKVKSGHRNDREEEEVETIEKQYISLNQIEEKSK